MMGIFGKIASYVYNLTAPSADKQNNVDLPDLDDHDVIKRDSSHVSACYNDYLLSQMEENEESQHFHGKITSLNKSERYGLINKEVYFDFNTFKDNTLLKVGDDVSVFATRKCSDHAWCAKSVTLLESWDDNPDGTITSLSTESATITETYDPLTELKHEEYTIVAKVSVVNNGQGILNNDITFSLKDCSIDFRPIAGDWLSAQIVSVGNQCKVTSLVPLRELNIRSKITSTSFGGGIINGEIVFSNSSCQNGYYPRLGDLVDVRALESSQGRFEWRALSVIPIQQFSSSVLSKVTSPTAGNFLQQLLCDKEGIQITDSLNFGTLSLGEKKCITAWIRNEGSKEFKLLKYRLQSEDKNSQFSLGILTVSCYNEMDLRKSSKFLKNANCMETSSNLDGIILSPKNTASVNITCEARHLGRSQQLILFEFEGFVIGRHLNVIVQDPIQISLNPTAPYKRQNWKGKCVKNADGAWIVPGEKPSRPRTKFSSRLLQYTVPSCLWDATDDTLLIQFAPYLLEDLNITNYRNKFSTLLHLEEIQMMLDMKEFDMKEVCLDFRGECLSLRVPGLAEGRPSLLIGDKALLSSPSDDSPQSLIFEGYVHEVFQDSILLKFNSAFHDKYAGESYNVTFQFNRTPLRKCHQAVGASVQLGNEVLFPANLQLKKSLIDVLEPSASKLSLLNDNAQYGENQLEAISNHDSPLAISKKHRNSSKCTYLKESIDLGQSAQSLLPKTSSCVLNDRTKNLEPCIQSMDKQEKSPKHKFSWFNDKLNERQKTAVKRILSGQCRPTPYVIFGPPGTGKTVTIVEAVLQIFKNITFSRILICTPSNSAADLVAQRLIEHGLLQKADIVRLNSFQRVVENIPEVIRSFCANGNDLQLIAHHRIVVSTCITSGSFYTLGLRTDHFSHVFVDEAGQATEPECMIPVVLAATSGGQVILAGDPLQLGPVIRSPYAKECGLQTSFLERLMDQPIYHRDEKKYADHGNYDPFLVTKLVNNYRSHPAITEIFSALFYHSELISCAPHLQQSALCNWSLLPKSSFPVLFHGVKGEDFREGNSPSWFNPAEVVQVVKYLQSLYDHGLSPADVGIVTPYRKQVEKIHLLISSFGLESCKIGSVEEFQGQECLAIIISLVRSCDEYVNFDYIHNLGFLSNPKRFNVAVSRAQSLLIVIGDPHLLCNDPCWDSLLNYCCVNDSYVGCDLPSEYMKLMQEITSSP